MNIYSFISSIAFMLYISFGISAYRKLGRTPQSIYFLLLSISLAVYALGYVFSFGSPSEEWTRLWYRIALTGCTIFPVFIVILSLLLTRPNAKLKPVSIFLLSLPALIFITINYINSAFYAVGFEKVVSIGNDVTLPIIDASDPLTLVFMLYMVAYGFGGILLIQVWGYKSISKRIKKIAKVILYTSMATLILSLFTNYIAPAYEIKWIPDIAHINILLTDFAYYYSIQVYQFLTPSPHIAIKHIMKSAREIIVITNSANKIISINRHSLDLLEYNSDEIYTMDVHKIFIHDRQKYSGTLVSEAENNNRVEAKLVTKSGKNIPISLTTAKIYDEFKEVIARVFIGTDITNHVKITELLNQKEKLISLIAHDLRNPIGIALNISQELASDTNLCKDESDMLFEVQQSSLQRSLSLLENLLLWARIDDVDNFFLPENIDLYENVVTGLHFLGANIKAKELTVVNKIQPGFNVYADGNMINTVVRNLLNNAIKFTNQKGVIKILPISNPEKRGISIIDDGVGIDSNSLKNIFEVRKKVAKDSEGTSGTGLGLLICKEFIEKNDGRIWVNSSYGEGSEFNFELPLPKNETTT